MASADVETGHVPDVIPTRQHAGKESQARRFPHRASRMKEKWSESPRAGRDPPRGGRKSRPEAGKTLGLKRRQGAPVTRRHVSDSALLPPIRVSSVRHPGRPSSPTHDANETSSPTSNLSFPGDSLLEEEEREGAFKEERALTTIPPMVVTPAPDVHDIHGPRSPSLLHPRKGSQSAMEQHPRGDMARLSPIATTSDIVRLKVERRVRKGVQDASHDASAGSKTPPALPLETPSPKMTGKTKGGRRRVSMQSLPKLNVGEEPFSVRRKIEQFRKWHEEQYTEKLNKLRGETEVDQRQASARTPVRVASVEIDFTKILEDNMKNSPRKPGGKDSNENNVDQRARENRTIMNDDTIRCQSRATWRTWRNINDSDAYDDVSKYIEDNELLPAERVEWINSWLGDVEKAFGVSGSDDNDNDNDGIVADSLSVGFGSL